MYGITFVLKQRNHNKIFEEKNDRKEVTVDLKMEVGHHQSHRFQNLRKRIDIKLSRIWLIT